MALEKVACLQPGSSQKKRRRCKVAEVDRTVQQSWNTLILLSSTFITLRCSWRSYTFRTALLLWHGFTLTNTWASPALRYLTYWTCHFLQQLHKSLGVFQLSRANDLDRFGATWVVSSYFSEKPIRIASNRFSSRWCTLYVIWNTVLSNPPITSLRTGSRVHWLLQLKNSRGWKKCLGLLHAVNWNTVVCTKSIRLTP